jgi:hypothetical protein
VIGNAPDEIRNSGAPIDITPFKDDPELGTDPKRYEPGSSARIPES